MLTLKRFHTLFKSFHCNDFKQESASWNNSQECLYYIYFTQRVFIKSGLNDVVNHSSVECSDLARFPTPKPKKKKTNLPPKNVFYIFSKKISSRMTANLVCLADFLKSSAK